MGKINYTSGNKLYEFMTPLPFLRKIKLFPVSFGASSVRRLGAKTSYDASSGLLLCRSYVVLTSDLALRATPRLYPDFSHGRFTSDTDKLTFK